MRRSLSLKKVTRFHPDTLLEKTLARLFSGDFCDVPKNTFLVELLWVTASKIELSRKYLVLPRNVVSTKSFLFFKIVF